MVFSFIKVQLDQLGPHPPVVFVQGQRGAHRLDDVLGIPSGELRQGVLQQGDQVSVVQHTLDFIPPEKHRGPRHRTARRWFGSDELRPSCGPKSERSSARNRPRAAFKSSNKVTSGSFRECCELEARGSRSTQVQMSAGRYVTCTLTLNWPSSQSYSRGAWFWWVLVGLLSCPTGHKKALH